jgi:BirA family biotin operon repressor/biotin-[acetyl-CoA-carboxylase] ligase
MMRVALVERHLALGTQHPAPSTWCPSPLFTSSMADDFPSPIPVPDDIAEAIERLRERFNAGPPRLLYFPSVTSTNDLATRLADGGAPDGTTVVAELQTAGRGRLGRSWFSPPGAGLYASVVVRPTESGHAVGPGPFLHQNENRCDSAFTAALVTLTAGVALAEAVRTCTHLPVEIKWPNDLVVERRKLAGILTEASGAGGIDYVILGFGINFRSAAYPPEIADRATSIEDELGRAIERGTLLAECLASLALWNDALRAGRAAAILDRWRSLAPSSRGARVEWAAPAGTASGVTDGIDPDGALLVRTGDRTERIIAGEIRWV